MYAALRVTYLLFACSLTLATAQAEVEHHFSGFATLGLVSSDNPNLAFRRDIAQNDGSYDGAVEWQTDSLLGAQWQSRWSHMFDTSVQLVAKERFDNSPEKSIEWAFVRYRPIDGLDIRVGRMGTDIFMLSDYRQVGYAFPWARPPHDYYTLLSLYHFDGIDLNKRFDLAESTLNIKVFYGNSEQQYPLGFESDQSARLDFNPAGISLSLEHNHWKWRYSYVDVDINNSSTDALVDTLHAVTPLWPEAAEFADMAVTKGRHFRYHELGMGYDNNIWWVQAEATQLRSQTGIVPQNNQAYLSVGRRIEQFSIYALTGYAKPERDVLVVTAPANYPAPIAEQLTQLASAAELTLNGVRIQQKSYGVGVRWDFAAKMALKFQVEEFHIDKDGTNLWLQIDPTEGITGNQTSTVISLAMDVLF